MNKLALPFWIVSERKHVLNPPLKTPCDDPKAPHAFTSTEKLTAFLNERMAGRWHVNLVADDNGVLFAIADAHQTGAAHICFDPELDGSGGTLVSIPDIIKAFSKTESAE